MKPVNFLRLLAICSVVLFSCKKNTEDTRILLPQVTTAPITSVTGSSASGGGTISSEGASPVTARGVIISKGTLGATTTTDGTGTGSFTSNITGLAPFTTYFVKAYATNANGTAYGNLVSFKTGAAPPATPVDNDPLNLGNPTEAQPYPSFYDNYLKDNNYYKLAYSQTRGTPVWVAWHLQSDDLGSTARQDDFRPDPNLPAGWYQVTPGSYTSSGFNRGHNCPSGDRTSSVNANSSTFLMTNMIPQAPNFNQGPWGGLEDYIRTTLVGTTNEAYIAMGNFGSGGYNASNSLVTSMDSGNIVVPAKVWKVVLIMPKGNNDLSRINSNTVVLAVNMPNDNRLYTTGGTLEWRNYRTSVAALETEANAAGVPLDLFKRIADSVRPALKAKIFP